LIWYSIVEYTKQNIKKDKSHVVFFTNDKGFDFENLKKEFFVDTGIEIQILKTGGDTRIKYYDSEFGIFISHILRELDTSCRVPQLMSVLLTEFLSAFDIFSVFVEIDFVVID